MTKTFKTAKFEFDGAEYTAAQMIEANDHDDLLEVAISNAEYRAARDSEFGRGYNAAKNGQSRNLQRESTDWYEGYDARSAIAKATGKENTNG